MAKTKKKYPQSISEAVNRLIAELSTEDKESLAAMTEEDLSIQHLGLGMYIRNEYGLWDEKCPLRKGIFFEPDSCSSEIIKELWKTLKEKEKV